MYADFIKRNINKRTRWAEWGYSAPVWKGSDWGNKGKKKLIRSDVTRLIIC